MSDERFGELYERYCERTLSDAERAEFERLMADAGMRRRFVELASLDTLITEESRIAQHTPASVRTRRVQRGAVVTPLRFASAAAAVFALAVLAWLAFRAPAKPVVVAVVTRMTGEPAIQRGAQRISARAGLELMNGDIVLTRSAELLTCQFAADVTQVDVLEESVLTLALSPEAKRLVLDSGALSANVSPQPEHSPVVIKTPDAEARIVGTKFTVTVAQQQTTLAVNEGHVRMKRLKDSAEVDVKTGSFAVSGNSTAPLTAVAIPAVTGFSLIDADTGKPLPAFNPIPPGIDIAVMNLPTLHLAVAPNISGTVGSVRYELEGKTVVLSTPPFWGSAEHVRKVLKLDSKLNARYSLKATPYSGPNGSGAAGATYTLNGNIVVKR